MSGAVLTPTDVIVHLRSTDGAVATLESAFTRCDGLDPDQRTAFTHFASEYHAFSQRTNDRWTGSAAKLSILLAPVQATLDLQDDDAKILDFEHQIAAWQKIGATKCGLNVPGLTPRDNPDAPPNPALKTLEHIAVAGAVIVSGVGVLVAFNYIRKLF